MTEPVDAEIFIDGQKMADRSPMFLDASPGSYSVIVCAAQASRRSRARSS